MSHNEGNTPYAESDRDFVDRLFLKPFDAWQRPDLLRLHNIATRVTQDDRVKPSEITCRWVPVGERLPVDDIAVLFALRDRGGDDVWIGWHDRELGWVCDNGPMGERVTHWMPLPEAPK